MKFAEEVWGDVGSVENCLGRMFCDQNSYALKFLSIISKKSDVLVIRMSIGKAK
jgi:hypothetical protein